MMLFVRIAQWFEKRRAERNAQAFRAMQDKADKAQGKTRAIGRMKVGDGDMAELQREGITPIARLSRRARSERARRKT